MNLAAKGITTGKDAIMMICTYDTDRMGLAPVLDIS